MEPEKQKSPAEIAAENQFPDPWGHSSSIPKSRVIFAQGYDEGYSARPVPVWRKILGTEVFDKGTPMLKDGEMGFITSEGFGYEAIPMGYTHYIPISELLNLEKQP